MNGPQIGDRVRFRKDGIVSEGTVLDIRPAAPQDGTYDPSDVPGYYNFHPAWAPGTRLAYVGILGRPMLEVLDLAPFVRKRRGVWGAAGAARAPEGGGR